MRILLVEDDEMLGKATAEGLKLSYAVDWVKSAEEAEEALSTTDYSLIVLDINLPGKSGLEMLKDLRDEKGDERPVLMLTAMDSLNHKLEGLNSGADDYLVKPFDLDELLARSSALIRRSQGRSNPIITCRDISFNPQARVVKKGETDIALSARETSILEILMGSLGHIISKAQIEERMYDWNSGENIESNTVEVHVSSLRKKLGKDLIKTIRGIGYIIYP